MKNSLIADTGFWIALINPQDRFHPNAVTFLANCRQTLVTTWPVITETCYMLLSRRGVATAEQFLEMGVQGDYSIFPLDSGHLAKAAKLMNSYVDLPMDLADASLVLLAEALGHGRVLSTDQRDFNCYRWKNHRPFENLLIPDDGQNG
jgi:predicted nucleic acid-binding protein